MKINPFLLLSFLFLLGCSNDEDEIIQPPKPTTQERLQKIIDKKIGENSDKLVGVSVSIRVDGEERWNLVGGTSAVGEPITSDMRFGIGSVTKTAVAATVLKLKEEGLLNLEDRIGDHLTLNNPNVNDSITIFQLLTHFTGVRDYFQHPDLWPTVENNLDDPILPEALVGYIGDPINQPGLAHEYSNANYLLLGLIIEKATQKTVGEVMREKFWTPLQLNHIYFGSNEPVEGKMAVPWRDNDGDGILEDISNDFRAAYFSVFYCAAGIYATASDLSMWAYHLYHGNALSEESKNEMMTRYASYGDPVFIGYGLGARQNVYARTTMWGHTGGMRGYGTHMFYDPFDKVSIAILNNQSRSTNGPVLRHELISELLDVVFTSL